MDGVDFRMIQLSKRLQTVANYVAEGSIVADIGSDHALLPVYLVQSQKVGFAIAGEVNDGPLQAAKTQVQQAGLEAFISPRKGDGLAVIDAGEVNTITICGMGGTLMRDILEAGRLAGKLEGVTQLVLQPNIGEDAVRYWLSDHGFIIVDEAILEEDGKIYEIIHAHKSEHAAQLNEQLYDPNKLGLYLPDEIKKILLYRMGPFLTIEGTPVWHKKWKLEIEKLNMILKSLEQSTTSQSLFKKHSTQQEIKMISEVLGWQLTVKQ